ncbi:hypothetical protein [Rhodopirellula halodulae]|uniref:hypothetical protein n=1 Tax=Rhodopirellula halodulae TaxID=2894198 RepID=UPI001E536321|nr:hypothetical protein [Rhodopirellula sp. JC737]MCC9656856.1 hypothetical protein [Rhodopirellula sp. JC737]
MTSTLVSPTTSRLVRITCPECSALLELAWNPAANPSAETGTSETECTACHRTIDLNRIDRGELADTHSFAVRQEAAERLRLEPPSVERVLVQAMRLLRFNWKVLLIVSCFTTFVWFALVVWPCQQLSQLWSLAQQDPTQLLVFIAAGLMVSLVTAITTAYTTSVMARTTLAVSRYGKHTSKPNPSGIELGRLTVPFGVLGNMTCFMGIVGFLAGILLVLGVLAMVVCMLVLPMPRETATLVGTFVVGCVYFVLIFSLQWFLWPAVFLIADRRASVLDALSQGVGLAWRFRSISLKVVTFYFLLSTVGALLFYVGQAITTPLASLPLAVAYLRMTGGQTALDSPR